MTYVGAFVHLYHIWGLFGLITALVYSRNCYYALREEGITPKNYLTEFVRFAILHSYLMLNDWWRLLVGIFKGLTGTEGINFSPRSAFHVKNSTILMIGIALGGFARLFTALYWAERNTAWMTETTVLIPAVPVVLSIIADMNHHYLVWDKKPWRGRLITSLAIIWIVLGTFFYPLF